MLNDYKPVSCGLYDKLEEIAVRKSDCTIIYIDMHGEKKVFGKVIDFVTHNKEEFLVMEDSTRIRLDWIRSLNGEDVSSLNCVL